VRQRIPQVTVPRTPRKEDIRPFLETPPLKLNQRITTKDTKSSNHEDGTNERREVGKHDTATKRPIWISD
jgi:hypothetical protein